MENLYNVFPPRFIILSTFRSQFQSHFPSISFAVSHILLRVNITSPLGVYVYQNSDTDL